MLVRITVKDFDTQGKSNTVEVRWAETGFSKGLNLFTATKIMQAEYPGVECTPTARSGGIFHVIRPLGPADGCDAKYVWRQYYIVASTKSSMARYKSTRALAQA